MKTATEMFLNGMEKWVKAAQANDFANAKKYADTIVHNGELLALRPEFQQCFGKRCPGVNPQDVLNYISQFLRCATDCRSRALQT